MGTSIRPDTSETPDDDEFRQWQAARAGRAASAPIADPTTPDDAEFRAWQSARAPHAAGVPTGVTGDLDLRAATDRVPRSVRPAPAVRPDVTAVAPHARSTYQPNLLERAGAQVGALGHELVTHPAHTIAQLVTAPVASAFNAVVAPEIGEARPNPNLSKGGNSAHLTAEQIAAPYDREHGAITPHERAVATAQTLANIAFPGIASAVGRRVAAAGAPDIMAKLTGLAAAGAPTGAAYSPDDPMAGLLAGAALTPLLGAAHEGGARATRAVSEGVRTAAGSALDRLRARAAAREASAGSVEPSGTPIVAPRGTGAHGDASPAVPTGAHEAADAPHDQTATQRGSEVMLDEPRSGMLRGERSPAEEAHVGGTEPDPSVAIGQALARRAAVATAIGDASRPVQFDAPHEGDGHTMIVHRSTQEPGKIQVTRLNREGTPYGHETYDSIDDAVYEVARDAGDRLTPAERANNNRPATAPPPKPTTPEATDASAERVPTDEPPEGSRVADEPSTTDEAEFQAWQEDRAAGPTHVDDDGVQRFASARTSAGARRPVERVSTTGLLDELLDLEQKRADAEQRAVYEVREDENFHTDGIPQVAATRSPGGGPSRQAKALTNLDAFARAQREIETELAARGLSGDALTERLQDHHAEREERLALAGDFDARNMHRDVVTDELTGARLFSATPDAFRDRAPTGDVPPPAPEPSPQAEASATTTPNLATLRAVSRLNAYRDAFRRVFAPAARSADATRVALSIREHAGDFARRNEQARESMRQYAQRFNRMTAAEHLDFIDRIETGGRQPTPELQAVADLMRRLLDDGRDAIRALGTGKLEQWIVNYFPHLWENADDALGFVDRVMSKRNLAGPGTFLKHRSIPTMREGIGAGLSPLTTNPIDLTLLKLREMNKYLAGQRILAELKESGLATYQSALQPPPQALVKLDDKLGTVYGPPSVQVTEGFDALVRQDLESIMRELGVTHTRKPRIGGADRMGYAEGDQHVVTRSGGPDTVIEHELGHVLDARLHLWQRLTDIPGTDRTAIEQRKQLHGELRTLADLRIERSDPAKVAAGYKKYLRTKEEKIANAVHALVYTPERMDDVAPLVKARLTALLEAHPVARKVLDIRPSLVLGTDTYHVPTGGLVVRGHWYVPEPVGRLLNNYLSPGLRGNPFFDLYRGVGNVMNQWQLGFSAFHLGFTSMDAAVSKSALAVEQLAAGKPIAAAGSLVRTPIAPFENYLRGSKVLREYLRPGTEGAEMAQLVDALVKGGGRVRMDEFYGGSGLAQFREALRRGRYGSAARLSLSAITDAASYAVMEHIVPRQKLGVFADLARFELGQLPEGATKEHVRAVMARAWDSVDNRMGQMVYDNLFWHRVAKDLTMASVRSVGWNLGTLRELGGGMGDLVGVPRRAVHRGAARLRLPGDWQGAREPLGLSHRAAYVVALPVTVGMAGAIINYLYTGEPPRELKDYFFPRTGRMNPDGTEERVQLPSYMRDVFDYARHPVGTLENKAHPLLGTLRDMLANRDFYGHEIRNPDDPLVQQVAQESKYLVRQFEPFSVRNAVGQAQRGQTRAALLNSVGITPAPREETRTAADLRMSQELGRRARGELTPKEVERQQERRAALNALRGHDTSALAKLRAAYESGAIAPNRLGAVMKEAELPADVARFKRLSLEEAMHVFQLATPAEKARYQPILFGKLAAARHSGARLPEMAPVH